jgi:sulfite exporter TauE/SafE
MTAFSIGLLGGAHCIGMCGGLVGALAVAIEPKRFALRFFLILTYNLGRIFSYVFVAVIFYLLIHRLQHYYWLSFLRIFAGLMLIAMGLYVANWWKGLVYLEKLGRYFWRLIQPLSQSLLPVKHFYQAFLLGSCWGWLPCGLIYSALAYSFTANTVSESALIMLSFALGTLPAVMFSGLLADRVVLFVQNKNIRIVFALLIIAFGVWTLSTSLTHGGQHSNTARIDVKPIVNSLQQYQDKG